MNTFLTAKPRFKAAQLALAALGLISLVACGPEKDPIDNEGEPTLGLTVQAGGQSTKANFTLPEADSALAGTAFSVPLERASTEAQEDLARGSLYYPIHWMWNYKDLLPHPELYCPEPGNGEFIELAEKLGGFKKTTSIYIEKDATAPRVQTGLMVDDFFSRFAPEVDNAGGGGGGAVTIQRPNIVGRTGNKAFYLSDTYGLITVDFSNIPFTEPSVSCAQPLPGRPENFVVTDDHLFAIIKDTTDSSTAVIQFDIRGENPVYVKSLHLENRTLHDARLFNDTLVMYLSAYSPLEQITTDYMGEDGASVDRVAGNVAPTPVDSDSITLPRYNRQYTHHELAVVSTLPELSLINRESFLPEGSDNPVGDDAPAAEAPYSYRNFQNFLSASGEYLLVTEYVNKRIFTGYQTRRRYVCDDYQVTEVPYSYCRTQWKRVENPDYEPPTQSGVLNCSGTLADCLKTQAPRVNRYIYVADGEQCHEGIRHNYSCISGSTREYQVPQYTWEQGTQIYAFRFADGSFQRLDDQLAFINKEGDIQNNGDPFLLDGRVQKHDHMQFHGDNLYVITTNEQTDQTALRTLTISGNSAIDVSALHLEQNGNSYSSLSAIFSDDKLYLSDGGYRSSNSGSELYTISLENPLAPELAESVTIPTRLDQLFFVDNSLIGLGRVNQNSEATGSRSMGSVTRFDESGIEQSSLLLGVDYRYYQHNIYSDDQIVTVDDLVKRLFLPYSVRLPIFGEQATSQDYRLSIANYADSQLSEEATLSFPQMLDRTVSIDEQSALGFSSQYIHQLKSDDSWSSVAIFDGEIPQSIYYTQNYPTQVQKRVRAGSYNFRLIDSDESASGDTLAEVTVERSVSNVCLTEQVLFDRDRILIAREKAGLYITWEDCPTDRNETEMELIGYRIGETDFTAISDQDELALLLRQSQWDMICITDLDNQEGEVVQDYTVDEAEELNCFTIDQYYELLSEETGFTL